MRRTLSVIAILATAATACSLISGLDDFELIEGERSTGGAPPDAGADAVCPHATYPPPPDVSASGGAIEFVVAVRAIDFGETTGSPPTGLDVDVTCTCQGEGPTCASLNGGEQCDLPEGRDNATSAIIGDFANALGPSAFGSAFYSTAAENGGWSILMRVRDYSGVPDDDRVRLDWYISTSFANGNPAAPAWNGEDMWPVSTESLNAADAGLPDGGIYDLDDTKINDQNAYVANGVLVAALPEAAIRLADSINTFSMVVSGGFLVARIEEMPGVGYVLRDATLVGRWTLSEAFKSISSYRDNDGMPFCISSIIYNLGKARLCNSADILEKPGSPTTPCDALSLGIVFQTHPARLGSVFNPPAPLPGCDPTTDPANDSCN